MSEQLTLFNGAAPMPEAARQAPEPPDQAARDYAVDPANNVVLEASAGTGKTSVLVSRYVNLLRAGIDPAHILAITFTRKAAAEMRERIMRELRKAAATSEMDKKRWLELRDRAGDIAISTIDAFCLSLLREFPLEADLDPGFEMADETEVPRLIDESLDRSLRILVAQARQDHDIALVLAQLGIGRTREGLASLLQRRLVAWEALDRFLVHGPRDLTAEIVCRRAAVALHDVLRTVPGGLARFLAEGPAEHPRYGLFLREVERLGRDASPPDAAVRGMLERISGHFLTNEGKARKAGTQIHPYKPEHYPSRDAAKRHRDAVFQIAPHVERVIFAFNRDLNVVLARGVRRMFAVALEQYRRALEQRSVLDFSDVLERAVGLLRQMDEFSQSRFRLESRYHHVLVDEFQDTSRAQWELVSLLVRAWGEGLGLASSPSIFIVGDRKQSIYRFRDADVSVMHQATRFIDALRQGTTSRRAISKSFRSVPQLLEFVNDVFAEMSQPAKRPDEFEYTESDRFPVDPAEAVPSGRGPALGIAVSDTPEGCASAVAEEIQRILAEESIRDKNTGIARQARPGDIAILFRSRASHREFERELERRAIPTYVYKGLGFFDADEIKDLTALIRYLAEPTSDLRAAAFLRSRLVRLSDPGLALLAPELASSLLASSPPRVALLGDEDRQVLEHVRPHLHRWLERVDRIPPGELLDEILSDTAYAYELRGGRRHQAWENVKKLRGLVRRIQNRGYATLRRIGDHIDALTAGDESNAVLEALDAVNLMTVHASKGLEFPVVFVVNLAKGASGPPKPVRVIVDGEEVPSVSVGPFVSEMDEADREREKHETRRLLYVALTRARDRLYLSSVLKDGIKLQPGPGSLADVMPESLRALFPHAATAFADMTTISWTGISGRVHEWRLCRPRAEAVSNVTRSGPAEAAPFVGPLPATSALERTTVSRWLDVDEPQPAYDRGSGTSATVGTLIHQLFRAAHLAAAAPEDIVAFVQPIALSLGLTHDDEATVREAIDAWQSMRVREDVAGALEGMAMYEVPFSFRHDGRLLRGVVDCIVRKPDGTVLVVEFKTGRARDSHERQLALYVEAVRTLFPDHQVRGVLLYA